MLEPPRVEFGDSSFILTCHYLWETFLMEPEKTREYRAGDLTVIWKPALCTHSTNCWRQLGAVFDPRKRPWINMEGAASHAIVAQVERCPSGALTWRRSAEDDQEGEQNSAPSRTTD